MTDIKSGVNPLFLREEDLRQGMELLYYAYRDFTAEPDAILATYRLPRENVMLRSALLIPIFVGWAAIGPASADLPIEGKWICDYGVRKLSSTGQSSSAWFEVTFKEGGRFFGVGKATAAGSALPMVVRGAWTLNEGLLKLNGASDISNRVVPFRFVSKRVGDHRFKQREVKAAAEYRTSCKRDP